MNVLIVSKDLTFVQKVIPSNTDKYFISVFLKNLLNLLEFLSMTVYKF